VKARLKASVSLSVLLDLICKEYCLLRCDAVQFSRNSVALLWNTLLQSHIPEDGALQYTNSFIQINMWIEIHNFKITVVKPMLLPLLSPPQLINR
jgi:hypothetical protein